MERKNSPDGKGAVGLRWKGPCDLCGLHIGAYGTKIHDAERGVVFCLDHPAYEHARNAETNGGLSYYSDG